jgi:hypothetical protein
MEEAAAIETVAVVTVKTAVVTEIAVAVRS